MCGVIECNEWRTEKRHECANMGKEKRVQLWWQLYVTWLPVRDRKFQSEGFLFDWVYSIDCLVFITETECVYCAVVLHSTFCPHSVFMCFVWIWEQTAIISLYNIDWLVGFCNWDGVCLLRGTFYILRSAHTVYLCVLCGSESKQRLFRCTALTGWFL